MGNSKSVIVIIDYTFLSYSSLIFLKLNSRKGKPILFIAVISSLSGLISIALFGFRKPVKSGFVNLNSN